VNDNVVRLSGLPDGVIGCMAADNSCVHLGFLFSRVTACGLNDIPGDILLQSDVDVDCPECVAEMRYRRTHPDAAKKMPGIVTCKAESPAQSKEPL
jgi:hypothetical protein